MPPWNRPNIADTRYSDTSPSDGRNISSATPCSTEPSSSVRRPPMRSEIQPETSRLTTPMPEHQRQHLGAARRAEAEVAAVGDDVHLRHRHRHAAGHAGDAQQRLQRSPARRPSGRGRSVGAAAAGAPRRGAPAPAAGGRRPQHQRQRQHGHQAEHAHADVGLAPAHAVDEVLHHRRPDRAGHVVAAHADRQRDAAAAVEPLRGVGHQRREGRRGAEQADQQALRQAEQPQRRAPARPR